MRVFVTAGAGISCLGPESMDRLFMGESGLRPWGRNGFEDLWVGQVEGETKGPEPRALDLDRIAVIQTLTGVQHQRLASERKAVFASVSKGNFEVFGPRGTGPWLIDYMSDRCANSLRDELGWQGCGGNYPLACASGLYALGAAYEAIVQGRIDMAVAGASEASLTPLAVAAFENLGALAPRGRKPLGPFETGAQGFVMAEGAAFLLLENEFSLKLSGATPLAEIKAWACNSDAYHLTAPRPDGSGAAKVMRLALGKAGLQARQIDTVNVHGTATPLGDHAEMKALGLVFDSQLPPLTALKAATGHMLGASGAFEAWACVEMIRRQKLACSFTTAKLSIIQNILKVSLGFGGHNVAMVFSKC